MLSDLLNEYPDGQLFMLIGETGDPAPMSAEAAAAVGLIGITDGGLIPMSGTVGLIVVTSSFSGYVSDMIVCESIPF
jgi:hypothetical protein